MTGVQTCALPIYKSELECYSCGEKGHISSDPICKNFHKRGNHPRLNAQRLIEDDQEDKAPQEQEAPQDEVEPSEYLNSWGGSQYDHPEDDDCCDGEYPSEDIPEGEDDSDVRMSTMHVQMHAMCRISDTDTERSSRILELSILSRISHTDPPSNESESIHSHLYVDDEDQIQDPVYIEYRDGRIYNTTPMTWLTRRHWPTIDPFSALCATSAIRRCPSNTSPDSMTDRDIGIPYISAFEQLKGRGLKRTSTPLRVCLTCQDSLQLR